MSLHTARAFAWEFTRRHRAGFAAIICYIISLAVLRVLLMTAALTVDSTRFAFSVIVPATSGMLYLLAVFCFGLSGDMAQRESMFPSRLFTLPVTTTTLTAYPMLFGMGALSLFWFAIALLGLRPAGLHVPLVWPALFAAVFLGWAQTLIWLPYGLRGVRVMLATAWLATVDTSALLAIFYHASQRLMILLLAPQLPLGFLAARQAVTLARRGVVPDWSMSFARTTSLQRRRRAFVAPSRAQLWFEWREQGRSLVELVATLLPFELALLFAGGSGSFVLVMLAMVLLTPVFMAACTAATMRAPLTPFIATRPLADRSIIAAKLYVAVLSTLLTWLMVITATVAALTLSHTWAPLLHITRGLARHIGNARTIVLALLLFAGLLVTTWKQLVQTLYIGMSGRTWLMKMNVFITLVFMVALVPVSEWISGSSAIMSALWRDLRWILSGLVLLKMSASAWSITRLNRNHLLSERSLLEIAAVWTICVLALHALLLWLLDSPHVPAYFLMLIAILATPFARIAASPLALAWNRHR